LPPVGFGSGGDFAAGARNRPYIEAALEVYKLFERRLSLAFSTITRGAAYPGSQSIERISGCSHTFDNGPQWPQWLQVSSSGVYVWETLIFQSKDTFNGGLTSTVTVSSVSSYSVRLKTAAQLFCMLSWRLRICFPL
jgi:hypothetical protein